MSGSVQAKLSQTNLNQIPVPYPAEESHRRAIAHVLGTLDDKIELNRRMNETLESMARALFKDWFVDFGPVRAKMAGREPYLPPDVWSLFPDRLAPSELGDIPAGWQVGTVGDVAELLREGPHQAPSRPAIGKAVNTVGQLPRDLASHFHTDSPGHGCARSRTPAWAR